MTRSALLALPATPALLLVCALAAGCYERNPAYCDETTLCPDPADVCSLLTNRCHGPESCTSSSDCPAVTPICEQDQCLACEPGVSGDAACAERDPAAPRCAAGGGCVQCLSSDDCSGTTPVCDNASGTCRACADHEECVLSEVCDLDAGSCRDPASIVYVAANGIDSSTCGTTQDPCGTVSGSSGALEKVTDGRRTIRVRPGTYEEAIDIDFGEAVAIIGKEAHFSPPLSSNVAGLQVRNGSIVIVDGLELREATGGSNAHGVECESSTIDLRRVRLTNNAFLGLSSSSCEVTVTRSSIDQNDHGGLRLDNSSFTIRNNVIAMNGTFGLGGSIVGGAYISNGAALSPQLLEFNTLAGNNAGDAAVASGVFCTTMAPVAAPNNIVYFGGGGTAKVSGSCAWSYSDVEDGATGAGNLDSDPLFVDGPNGDFHLTDESPCHDAADPAAILDVDFDGDSRPQGGRSDVGADEVSP